MTFAPYAPVVPVNLELYREPFLTDAVTPPVSVSAFRGNAVSTISPSTGTAMYTGIPLAAGQRVSSLSLLSIGAESGGSHCWLALADVNGIVVAVSADNTAAGFWGASTAKTIAMLASYVAQVTGLHFGVLGMTASGMATFVGGGGPLQTGESGWGLGKPYCGTAGSIGAPPAIGQQLTFSALAGANLKFVAG